MRACLRIPSVIPALGLRALGQQEGHGAKREPEEQSTESGYGAVIAAAALHSVSMVPCMKPRPPSGCHDDGDNDDQVAAHVEA